MESDNLLIDRMSLAPTRDSVMELANCSGTCKKNRCSSANTCTCLQNSVPCTELCKCARKNCNNVTGRNDPDEDDEDEVSDSEED